MKILKSDSTPWLTVRIPASRERFCRAIGVPATQRMRMQRPHWSLTGASLTALFILGGCGSSSAAATQPSAHPAAAAASQGASAASEDACALVTANEAARVLAVPVRPAMSNGGGLACVYLPVTGSLPALSVNVVAGAGHGVNQAAFDEARAGVTDAADLQGVGDSAFTSGGGHNVTFLKGATVALLTVQAADPVANYTDRLIAAAKVAAGRAQ